ncbi:hypothetical protein CXU22_00830 [Akkermansia muciniphila]|uniref:Uncharacterized protein n=1 Tax=Akkermansia muciniphila TaxID=239935 RepID=A0A2N8HH12_9BACT|nr:hypothetical protein CXU22_00830 [Akkermansia muciniphila]
MAASRKNYPVLAAESSQLREGGERGGGRPIMGLIFRTGDVYSGRYRLRPPERKERAFPDQWIKLVFIGSKLERPRE